MKNLSKKTAKALAISMFAVGFVTPLMFNNIAEAENYGKGGSSTATFTAAQIETYSAKNSSCTTTDWSTWTHNITDANCVMINGYRFKVVGNTTTNGKQILTLWSYNSTQTGATKSFATNVKYEADGDWSDSNTITAAEAYNNSDLKTAMDGLLTIDSTTGKPNGGELYDSNFTYVKYTSTTDSNVTDAYVWAPSRTEVKGNTGNTHPGTEAAGTWGLTSDAQRAIGSFSWLRSPYPDYDRNAYYVYGSGSITGDGVGGANLLRPALQILNQTSYVFTTNVAIPTDGVFTADAGSGTATNYALNSSATIVPTFTPATDGVTLNGTKIGIKTTDKSSGTYAMAGLLTEEADSAKNDTWANLNGPSATSTKGISYMAQVSSNELDLSGVATGTDYTLKVFGLNTTDTAVTELADNAVSGLSIGSDGVVHMKVGTDSDVSPSVTYNDDVDVTLKNDAVVDLVGDVTNNDIKVGSGDTGTLNLGEYTYSGAIDNDGTLTLIGADGTLSGSLDNDGTINIGNDDTTDDVITATVALGDVNINPDGTLITDADNLTGDVTNNGVLTLNGDGTLNNPVDGNGLTNIGDGVGTKDTTITANAALGDVNINSDGTLITDADNLTGDVTNNGVLTLNGDGTLNNPVDGNGLTNIGDGVGTKDTTITANAALGDVNINSDGTLVTDAKNLDGAVANDGVLTLTGSGADNILDQAVTGAGTINIGNADGTNDVITSTVALGAVNINPDGTLVTSADNLTETPTIQSGGTLQLTGGTVNIPLNIGNGSNIAVTNPLTIGTSGSITQAAGSNIVIPAPLVEADTNDASKAFFQGITDPSQLNVSAGSVTLVGAVQEGKYYVLVAGTAVSDKSLTAADLWAKDNITVEGMFNVEYATVAAGDSSIALQVTNATTYEEGNTSGLAAVQQGNISVAKEFTDEVANRLSFVQRPSLKAVKVEARDVANTNKDEYSIETVEQGNANEVMPVQVVDKDKYDKEVWASYIRTKETTEGMKLGAGLEGNNTAQYNGAVVGVDFYSSDKAIAGVAFSYTTGDIDSYSGTTTTRNKSKYYGVSFYDRVTNGNNALIYDIGYIKGDNDISQFYTGEETTADVKTDTYTAGVRYETAFETGKSRVVPFASFRYMRQNNKDYTNSHGTRFESSNQNLYIPKVGVAWTGDFIMPNSVWTWRPSVEAGYVWNLGDRSVDSNVFTGASVAGIEYDTVDKSSYYAKAGMEFINKNFTAGVFYRYLKGSAVRNNKWNVNVSWSF